MNKIPRTALALASVAIVAIFASQANAQDTTPPPAPSQAPLPAPLPAPPQAPLPAPGQPPGQAAGQSADGEPRRPWTFTPFVSLTETYSDNVAAVADALARSGWITDLTPCLRSRRTATSQFSEYRLRLRLDRLGARHRQNFSRLPSMDRKFRLRGRAGRHHAESRSPFGAPPGRRAFGERDRVEPRRDPGQVGDYANLLRARAGEVHTDDRPARFPGCTLDRMVGPRRLPAPALPDPSERLQLGALYGGASGDG
jgi:hypothetical protein